MICNNSRLSGFDGCRLRQYKWDELRQVAHKTAEPLLTGQAFHNGIEYLFKTRDVEKAVLVAKLVYSKYRELLLEKDMLLPEDEEIIAHQTQLAQNAVWEYGQVWTKEPWEIIMPEVEFTVPLPDTLHHCWFCHRLLYPDIPFEECDNKDLRLFEPHQCIQPHYLRGKADAVISWKGQIWIMEHKTASSDFLVRTGENYYRRFQMSRQPDTYIYGVWKKTGVRPHGFILNVAKKPPRNASNQFKITFERREFSVTDEKLQNFEEEVILRANNYEEGFRTKNVWRNDKNCFDWQRICPYFEQCVAIREPDPGEYAIRSDDYVNKAYRELLGLVTA